MAITMRKVLLAFCGMYALGSFYFPVMAACPVCVSGIGLLVIIAKYLGMSLVSVGVLVGALSYSVLDMMIGRISKEKLEREVLRLVLFLIILYILMLYSGDSIKVGSYYIDRVVLGGVIGAILTRIALHIHEIIKSKNGKVLFKLQKVVIVLLILIVSTTVIHYLGW